MSQPKKNILVCGYPKSGTTWLSRLVADMLDAPFVGDWGFDTTNRSSINVDKAHSPFRVYKSHHLGQQLDLSTVWKVIHLIRDPRDIVVSGAYFFSMPIVLKTSGNLGSGVDQLLSKSLPPKIRLKRKLDRMIDAILQGDASITPWLGTSWLDHHKSFEDLSCHQIRYEELLKPEGAALTGMLQYLETPLAEEQVLEAYQRQSFKSRKAEAMQAHPNIQKLVRKGIAGDYKTHLEREQLERMEPLMQDSNNPYASYL